MELFSSRFQDTAIKTLDNYKELLGTIQKKLTPLTQRIKSRKSIEIISVNTNNRDYLPDRILTTILKRW